MLVSKYKHTACQKVILVSPNREGHMKFHSHIIGNPIIKANTTTMQKNATDFNNISANIIYF